MEYLLFLILVIILLVVLSMKGSVSNRLSNLESKLDILMAELKKARLQDPPAIVQKEKSVVKDTPKTIAHEAEVIKPVEVKPVVKEEVKEEVKPTVKEEPKPQPQVVTFPVVTPAHVQEQPQPQPPIPPKPGFFERNPDLEKFVGENLANKIGIGVLVLGIGFFVKYAIDKEWINEIGRVFIGILCGGILLGVAHKLRKTFAAFSSVLVGGGIAVLYLTIAIAFHEYELFSQTAAFIIMVVITGFAVALSITYNRIELAILSILGGFASPFMVSTGEGNYVVLFIYVLILDAGMLVLAYFKKWNLVNIVAYAFTIILFASWLGNRFDELNASMVVGALIFATLFYFVFFAMNLINNIKQKRTFNALEIGMLLSNTFFYYGCGIYILSGVGEEFQGLFTASLGIFNFIFSFLLYKKQHVDKNLVFLLIGLVLTFISLAAPVQLKGNHITLFWSAEAVLLLWLSQKSGIQLMKMTSVVVLGLMLISLIMDWDQIYLSESPADLTIIFNKGYLTSVFAIASAALTYYLLGREKTESEEMVSLYKNILLIGGTVLLYAAHLLELRHQLFQHGFALETQNIIIGCYNLFFLACLLWVFRKRDTEPEKGALTFAGTIGILAYLVFYHKQFITARDNYLFNQGSSTGFVFHYMFIAFLLIVAFLALQKAQELKNLNRETHFAYSWFFVFFILFLASAELDHIVMLTVRPTWETSDHVLTQNHKIGYPILWGLSCFVLIFIGLKRKRKHLRIIALTVFLITLIKLFAVDIRGISEGGKIAAFISLGLLLLIVSFMYQRLKKLLLTDEPISDDSKKTGNP